MKNLKEKFLYNSEIKQYTMLIALVILFVIFGFLTNGINLTPMNISNMVVQNAYVLVLAVGMLLIIITGNIDLSVGSVVGFVGAISGILIIKLSLPVWIVVLICLMLGTLIGMFNGYLVAYKQVPAFIVTLSGMMIFRGLTMFVLNGQTLAPYPDSFQFLASGFLFPDMKVAGLNIFAIAVAIVFNLVILFLEIRTYKKQDEFLRASSKSVFMRVGILLAAIDFILVSLARYNGIPTVFILLVILISIYSYFMKNITYGRHIYAIGGNYNAALMSGVKNKKVIFLSYANMGFLAAISAIIVAARLNAATPNAGNMFEMDAVAACFIGGASAQGGSGTIVGAIIGGLIMATLNNGMSIMGVGVDIQQTVKGLVLLAAVLFDIMSKNKKTL